VNSLQPNVGLKTYFPASITGLKIYRSGVDALLEAVPNMKSSIAEANLVALVVPSWSSRIEHLTGANLY